MVLCLLHESGQALVSFVGG